MIFLPILLKKISLCKDYIQPFVGFTIVFIVYCGISLVWSMDKIEGVKSLIYFLIHLVSLIEILVFSRFSLNPRDSITKGWLAAVVLTLFVAMWELITDNHLPLSKHESDMMMNVAGNVLQHRFASVTFYNYNGYVTFLCFAMPFLLYRLMNGLSKEVRSYFVPIIAIILSIIVILYNASRGGIVSSILIIAIFILQIPKGKYSIGMLTMLFLISGVIVYLFGNEIFKAIIIRLSGESLFDGSSRIAIWQVMWRLFLSSYGMGVGIGGIEAAAHKVWNGITVPHNLFIEIAVEFGIVAITIFMIFLIRLLRKAYKQTDYKVKILLYSAIIVMPVYGIINSRYLLSPYVYLSLASLTVFAEYKRIRRINT